ncbi:hypothetical protein FJ987_10650 [Mesorhizobium sp. CU2]|nr:hypothetical protein FJ988_07975 [Mesorhizobium sp. CU3]TPO16511.1 hypothetical protein FJ987_10650 [Mesorhizobium sp. CU2]
MELTGLALSGGGIRSAAFCLGVLQGLDASIPDKDGRRTLDNFDYLSTVSGGTYIGASTVAGMFHDKDGRFPYKSSLDQAETIETQHLRDFANYLVPGGVWDALAGIMVLVRGLLVNAVMLLCIVFGAAAFTVWRNPNEADLRISQPTFMAGKLGIFGWVILIGTVFVVVQVAYVILSNRPREWIRTTLAQREAGGAVLAAFAVLCGLVALLDLQAFVLVGLFDAAHLNRYPTDTGEAGWLGVFLHSYSVQYSSVWSFLGAAVGAFGIFGSKLLKVAQATLGDNSWTGFLKHWGSRLAVYVGALLVPVAIWACYILLAYVAIQWDDRGGKARETGCTPAIAAPACVATPLCSDQSCRPMAVCTAASAVPATAPQCDSNAHTPEWLETLAGGKGSIVYLYLAAFIALLAISLLVTPNANSLHSYYRDRLSRSFLWLKTALEKDAHDRRMGRYSALAALLNAFRVGRSKADPDTLKLSQLRAVTHAPYLLVNTAVNLEASKFLNRRGRNADSFIFSPLYTGSEATGYADTLEIERVDRHVNLATAMAISGAAASANMGASTIKPLTFSLAVLNIRLGYWLPNPRCLPLFGTWRGSGARIGPYYFAKEAFGLLDEWTRNVYLTDGGHFDNLGLYQLIKRRCKVIVIADAEEDPGMNFESFIRLQQYIRIDLGVRIDLPWEEISRWSRRITPETPHGPDDNVGECAGPHIAVGKIEYGGTETPEPGVLIYIKASMTGDENDLIRDYRRVNPTFPQETTLDQFFTEEQFEVYRALGFHATKGFFSGNDKYALRAGATEEGWPDLVEQALTRLNLTPEATAKIMARQRTASRGHAGL